MGWNPIPSTFERARRKEVYRRLARLVTGGGRAGLPHLEHVQSRLRTFEQRYVGIRSIPIDRIVGTAGRADRFSAGWLPTKRQTRERWVRLEKAFPEGHFPPIVVYKIDESYFVSDGHHRVAIAKQRRMEFIDAEVTELRTRYPIPDLADVGRLIHAEQQGIFMEESGLDRARPESHIEFTRPHGYVELLELVKVHGYHLMMERNEVMDPADIAGDWYDRCYLPAVQAIRRERLADDIPGATEADLWLWVWQRRRALFPERGGMTLEEAVRDAREQPPRRAGPRVRRAGKKLRSKTS